jgi:hypothetical protein
VNLDHGGRNFVVIVISLKAFNMRHVFCQACDMFERKKHVMAMYIINCILVNAI